MSVARFRPPWTEERGYSSRVHRRTPKAPAKAPRSISAFCPRKHFQSVSSPFCVEWGTWGNCGIGIRFMLYKSRGRTWPFFPQEPFMSLAGDMPFSMFLCTATSLKTVLAFLRKAFVARCHIYITNPFSAAASFSPFKQMPEEIGKYVLWLILPPRWWWRWPLCRCNSPRKWQQKIKFEWSIIPNCIGRAQTERYRRWMETSEKMMTAEQKAERRNSGKGRVTKKTFPFWLELLFHQITAITRRGTLSLCSLCLLLTTKDIFVHSCLVLVGYPAIFCLLRNRFNFNDHQCWWFKCGSIFWTNLII